MLGAQLTFASSRTRMLILRPCSAATSSAVQSFCMGWSTTAPPSTAANGRRHWGGVGWNVWDLHTGSDQVEVSRKAVTLITLSCSTARERAVQPSNLAKLGSP